MKIALFHNLPPGGAKRALFEHARFLSARGHTLDAFVMSAASEDFLPLAPFSRQIFRPQAPARPESPAARAALPGAVLSKVQSALMIRRLRAWHKTLETAYRQIAAEIDAGEYDLVYVHHCRFLLSPYLLRFLKTPAVYYCQDTWREAQEWAIETMPGYDTMRVPPQRRRVRGSVVGRPQARLLEYLDEQNGANARCASMVLANSWYSREAILRAYGIAARLCYLGVDGVFFSPAADVVRERSVLSVGNLGYNKRHDFIIDAVAAIPASRRPLLRIVGYEVIAPGRRFGDGKDSLGPLALSLLKRAEEQGVSLTIDKEVSDEALRQAYRTCGVAAFAPHLEPFGFVPLEAAACGAAVVGVAEGGVRESVENGKTGLLTDRDAREFGAALDRILCDQRLAEILGAAGREAVLTRWTWEQSTDGLESLFSQVTKPRGNAAPLSSAEEAPCASP